MCLLNIIRTLLPASTGVTLRLLDTLHALIRRLGLSVTRPTSRGKRGGFRKQRVIQTRITHRFDVVPWAIKSASANVSQLINLHVVKHHERDIPLTICCLNARSVKNKALSVADFVIFQDIDVLALSETWLGNDMDNQVINELVPSGYTIQHISRPSEKHGGGVAILYKCGLTIKTMDFTRNGMFTHFEHMDCTVISNDVNMRVCIVYRPPPSK